MLHKLCYDYTVSKDYFCSWQGIYKQEMYARGFIFGDDIQIISSWFILKDYVRSLRLQITLNQCMQIFKGYIHIIFKDCIHRLQSHIILNYWALRFMDYIQIHSRNICTNCIYALHLVIGTQIHMTIFKYIQGLDSQTTFMGYIQLLGTQIHGFY